MSWFKATEKQQLAGGENRNLGIEESTYINIFSGRGSNYKNTYAMKLATVYRCVNLIADSVASLPLIPYQYNGLAGDNWKYTDDSSVLYNLLNVQPNPYISSFDFKKLWVINLLLTGNCYILIIRNNKGEVVELQVLATDRVEVKLTPDKKDIKYYYTDNGKTQIYDKTQVIHIKNYYDGGLIGKSTIEFAAETLGLSYDSEASARNWFQGFVSGIISPKAGHQLTTERAKTAKEAFASSSSNGITFLGEGLEFQRINVSPKDSQLLDSRVFNIRTIASFFGVPNSYLGLDSKYSTSEQETLSFLNNTLQPLLEKIESEVFRKLFLPSQYSSSDLKFNVENLMRLDALTRADYYSKMFQSGFLTVNEVREKIDAKNPVKGGNRNFIQVNLQALDNLISEQPAVADNSKQIDNKLK